MSWLARRRLARWVNEHATPVEIADVESAARADVEALAWLDPLVAGKRFAFVGEANHFVHEKLGYRLFVTRYLASRGFTVLLEELAWSDGVRIGRYLESGDEAWLERVGTFGYEGDARPDRDDRWTGYFAQSRERYPTAAFKHEHVRLLARAARDPAAARRATASTWTTSPAPATRTWASSTASSARSRRRCAGESIEAEIARLESLVRALEARRASAAQLRTARSLRDGFRYTALIKDAPTLESLRPGMAFRESVMHEQADDVVASYPADTRFIVFAHDLHLARDDARVGPGAGVGPGGGRVDSIGTHLAKRHPGQVFAIWMLDFEGRDSQPLRRARQSGAGAARLAERGARARRRGVLRPGERSARGPTPIGVHVREHAPTWTSARKPMRSTSPAASRRCRRADRMWREHSARRERAMAVNPIDRILDEAVAGNVAPGRRRARRRRERRLLPGSARPHRAGLGGARRGRLGVPDRIDDEGDHLGGGDEARRAGQARARPADGRGRPRARQDRDPARFRRRRDTADAHAAARDHPAAPAHAHFRLLVRPVQQGRRPLHGARGAAVHRVVHERFLAGSAPLRAGRALGVRDRNRLGGQDRRVGERSEARALSAGRVLRAARHARTPASCFAPT